MDLARFPLTAISIETKKVISMLLNPVKVIPGSGGLSRDWRGLAHVFGMTDETIQLLASDSDPSDRILILLIEDSARKATIKDLQNAFETIERWDVLEETENLFMKDAQEFAARIRAQIAARLKLNEKLDREVLTIGDVDKLKSGSMKQHYDAFLLYADEDYEFAKEMVERLEKENLKLCIRERDIVGGVAFEHETIMQLISERCNYLIVIISPSFLESPANKFFIAYGQAVGIYKQQRKLIPCIYRECQIPYQLAFTNKINYNHRKYCDFWKRLCDSLQPPAPPSKSGRQISNFSQARSAKESTKQRSTKLSGTKPKSRASLNHAKSESELSRVSTKSLLNFAVWIRKRTNKSNSPSISEINSKEQGSNLQSSSSSTSHSTSDSIGSPSTHSEQEKEERRNSERQILNHSHTEYAKDDNQQVSTKPCGTIPKQYISPKNRESLNHAKSEPELSRISTKRRISLSSWMRRKSNKLNNSLITEVISEEHDNDLQSLPSALSDSISDSISTLSTYSEQENEKRRNSESQIPNLSYTDYAKEDNQQLSTKLCGTIPKQYISPKNREDLNHAKSEPELSRVSTKRRHNLATWIRKSTSISNSSIISEVISEENDSDLLTLPSQTSVSISDSMSFLSINSEKEMKNRPKFGSQISNLSDIEYANEGSVGTSENNESRKNRKIPKHTKSEPELSRVSTKSRINFVSWIRKKTNKSNDSITSEVSSENQDGDLPFLPSPPTASISESTDVLPIHSEKKKKKKKRPKLVNAIVEKIPFMPKS